MRLLADENFPKPIVEVLRADGNEVLWARTACAGWKDVALLDFAESEARIMLTLVQRCAAVARPYGELLLPYDLRIRSRLRTRLVMVMEVDGTFTFERKAAADAANPRVQAWETLMWKYQEAIPGGAPGAKWQLLDRIFELPPSPGA